jgi:hypothetical protein
MIGKFKIDHCKFINPVFVLHAQGDAISSEYVPGEDENYVNWAIMYQHGPGEGRGMRMAETDFQASSLSVA